MTFYSSYILPTSPFYAWYSVRRAASFLIPPAAGWDGREPINDFLCARPRRMVCDATLALANTISARREAATAALEEIPSARGLALAIVDGHRHCAGASRC
jgi:hypothetical protein